MSVQCPKAGKAVDCPHILLAKATLLPATARKQSADIEAMHFTHTEEHQCLNEERQNSVFISPSHFGSESVYCALMHPDKGLKLSFECVLHMAVECDWECSPFPIICLCMCTESPEAAVGRKDSRSMFPYVPRDRNPN